MPERKKDKDEHGGTARSAGGPDPGGSSRYKKPTFHFVSIYAVTAYNGEQHQASTYLSLEACQAAAAALEAEGWETCESMGLFLELIHADGTRELQRKKDVCP